jgi:predicted lipoprotein with Yx(FWY)xxD motif
MKKNILVMLLCLVGFIAMSSFTNESHNNSVDKDKKGYFYCTFSKDGELVSYYTNVFSTNWDEYKTGIRNELDDAIDVKFKKTSYKYGHVQVWGPFESSSLAEKDKRKSKANLDSDFSTREFLFSYYGD